MQRWKLLIEYDGTPFVGWQRQDNGPSVQAALERAVAAFAQEERLVQCAGRTDAGVHALGQVAHVDIEKPVSALKLRDALNHHLKPDPVAVLTVDAVSQDFHARFSATGRAYLYRVLDRRAPPTLERGKVWHTGIRLDAEAMHAAAQALLGRHDFSSFRAAECQADSPIRTLDRIAVARVGEEVHLTIGARSFLHHQVRNIMGTLAMIGRGKRPIGFAGEVLAACDRTKAGPTAPPDGLYLTQVTYDDAACSNVLSS